MWKYGNEQNFKLSLGRFQQSQSQSARKEMHLTRLAQNIKKDDDTNNEQNHHHPDDHHHHVYCHHDQDDVDNRPHLPPPQHA